MGPGSPAQAAHEALGVVGAAQGGDDLARDEVPAAVAAGAIELLVVLGTDVFLVLEEEARLGQATATHLGKQGEKQGRLSPGRVCKPEFPLGKRPGSDLVRSGQRMVAPP